jgi:hypothetical protein
VRKSLDTTDGQSALNSPPPATPYRRHGRVDQEISQHRAAEGSADGEVPSPREPGPATVSQTQSAKDSGHSPPRHPPRGRLQLPSRPSAGRGAFYASFFSLTNPSLRVHLSNRPSNGRRFIAKLADLARRPAGGHCKNVRRSNGILAPRSVQMMAPMSQPPQAGIRSHLR